MSSPYMMPLSCTWQNKEIMMPGAEIETNNVTLRTHPIGVNQTTYGERSDSERPAAGVASAGLPYFACNFFLRQRFGRRVQKVSIDAGFTCPNVDGTVATGGCTFCDNRSFSPSRRLPRAGIRGQIDQSIARMRLRYRNCRDFLAYFQPATNTYAPVERLRPFYEEALAHPQVVGLVIGTRPDCVPDECSICSNRALAEARRRYVSSVEYGMQTMHDRSLDWMNRGHHHDAMLDAVERSRGRGFEIGAHVILGLPGESHDDMLATAREWAGSASTR